MVLIELLRDIATAIDRVELYVDGNRSFDSKNTLNGVAVFNDSVKTNVLAGKMAGRFTPPNPFNDTTENAVNTSALFIA
ncbi:305_t:CDS:2 [Funneliformis geosporum]|nr:305_t:CDS:2 [Funneliformis geosporum]